MYQEQIEKGLHYYEIYYNLDEGSTNINELETSCAGILGWAKSNNKIKLKIDDKIDIFLKEIEENIIIPQKYSSKKFSDGYFMGTFWFNCKLKKKLSSEPYKRLLTNDILKYDYQKELSLNDKIKQFIEEVNYKNKIPQQDNYFSNGESMGSFWYDFKKYKKAYNDLLEISILSNDYKNFSIEETKNNILPINEKITYFINFIDNQGIIPLPEDNYKFSDDENLGLFWLNCKEKINFNSNPYKRLLENLILKENYYNYLKYKYGNDTIVRAKVNYENFYNLEPNSSDIYKIHSSSAGINGWAK